MFLLYASAAVQSSIDNEKISKQGYATTIPCSVVVALIFIIWTIIDNNPKQESARVTGGIILIGLLIFILSLFAIALANFLLRSNSIDSILMGIALVLAVILGIATAIYSRKKEGFRRYYLDYINGLLFLVFTLAAVLSLFVDGGIALNYLVILLGIIGCLALMQLINRIILPTSDDKDNKTIKLVVSIPYVALIVFFIMPLVFVLLHLQNNRKLQFGQVSLLREEFQKSKLNIKEKQEQINEDFKKNKDKFRKIISQQLGTTNNLKIPPLNSHLEKQINSLNTQQNDAAQAIENTREKIEQEELEWKWQEDAHVSSHRWEDLYKKYSEQKINEPEHLVATNQQLLSALQGKKWFDLPDSPLDSSVFAWTDASQKPFPLKTCAVILKNTINPENWNDPETKQLKDLTIKTYKTQHGGGVVCLNLQGTEIYIIKRNDCWYFHWQDGSLIAAISPDYIQTQIQSPGELSGINESGIITKYNIIRDPSGNYILGEGLFSDLVFEKNSRSGKTMLFGTATGENALPILLSQYSDFSLTTDMSGSGEKIQISENGLSFNSLDINFFDDVLCVYYNDELLFALKFTNNDWQWLAD